MNTKQKWLLERLLIPAGILPPAIKYDDLRFNEQNRQQIGNVGFEYMLLLNQNPNLVSSSAIGKKIFAVHAPFSEFGASLAGKNKYTKKLATKLLYGNNKITDNFYKMSALTFQFAKNVGAKNITFHIGQLDHSNLKKSLIFLHKLITSFNLQATIEHEGPYIFDQLKYGLSLETFEGKFDWLIKPESMLKSIDQLIPGNNFKITFDTASLIASRLPIKKTYDTVQSRIGHVHLAGSAIGKDTAAEIGQKDIADLAEFLFQNKYSGYITAEIAGTQGTKENLLATIFGLSAFLNLNLFKKACVANAQAHIQNSCEYLLNNI